MSVMPLYKALGNCQPNSGFLEIPGTGKLPERFKQVM